MPEQEDPQRSALRALIESHGGNRTAMAAAMGMHRESMRRLLEKHDLVADADAAHARAGVTGPRPHLPETELDEEGKQVRAALAEHGGYRAAAVALGVSPRTMMRKIKRLGLSSKRGRKKGNGR